MKSNLKVIPAVWKFRSEMAAVAPPLPMQIQKNFILTAKGAVVTTSALR